MQTILDRFIKPAFRNFSWKPTREWMLVLGIVAIVVNGAADVFNGEVSPDVAIETAVLAVLALFGRGQTTSLEDPTDNQGRKLSP